MSLARGRGGGRPGARQRAAAQRLMQGRRLAVMQTAPQQHPRGSCSFLGSSECSEIRELQTTAARVRVAACAAVLLAACTAATDVNVSFEWSTVLQHTHAAARGG